MNSKIRRTTGRSCFFNEEIMIVFWKVRIRGGYYIFPGTSQPDRKGFTGG
jgi:hypothetical protein